MRSASGSAPRPDGFSQEEVFENKVSFSRHQRAAAGAARYLAIIRLRTGLDFDDLVERIAVRDVNGLNAGDLPAAMMTPPIRKLIVQA